MDSKTKLFVICIDGARYDVINRWADQGHLPTFKMLMSEGSHGELENVLPGPHTALTWITLATGLRPEKHGYLYTFMPEGKNSFKMFHSLNINGKRLWDFFSDSGISSGMMDLPLTYPVSEVNGFTVSSIMTPAFVKDYTYPPKLSEVMDKYGGASTPGCHSRDMASLQNLYAYTHMRFDAIYELLGKYPVDVLFKHFVETELLNHIYSSYLYPNHRQYSPAFEPLIRDYYHDLDKHLGALINSYPDSTFILFSDHGSCAVDDKIYVNNILRDLGYFVPLNISSKKNDLMKSVLTKGAKLYSLLSFRLQKRIRSMIPSKYAAKIYKPLTIDADWDNTIAYCFTWGMIFINKNHKDYRPENHDGILDKLYADLESCNLIKDNSYKIYKKSEFFGKDCPDYFPDIYIYFHDNVQSYYSVGKDVLIEPCLDLLHNRHTLKGMFFAHGPGIKKNYMIDCSLLDLSPTLMHIMGSEVPLEMDGKVITDLFVKGSNLDRVIKYSSLTKGKREIKEILDDISF